MSDAAGIPGDDSSEVERVRRYSPFGLGLFQHIRTGEEGLARALDRIESLNGTFSTYATWFIRQAIVQDLKGSTN